MFLNVFLFVDIEAVEAGYEVESLVQVLRFSLAWRQGGGGICAM